MAKKKKHKSLVTVVPATNGVQIIKTPGNSYTDVTTYVPCLDKNGAFIFDNGELKKELVKEHYEYNKEHRLPCRKANKSLWTVSEQIECAIFRQSIKGGAFHKWQGDRRMGWGIYIPSPSTDLTPQKLGVGFNNEDVKVCEFRESGDHSWHGFPFNYMLPDMDYICDNALHLWERLGIIDKSDIEDIQNKEESVLS